MWTQHSKTKQTQNEWLKRTETFLNSWGRVLLLLLHSCIRQQLSSAQPQQPTYGSQDLLAAPSLLEHDVRLTEFIFKHTSVSRAESQPDRKAAGTEGSRSLLSASSAGRKKIKGQVGLAKRLRAKETAHEQSRHFVQ